ncbi:MAG: cysteine hydrolase [Ruminococcaceae bacterium]|nr:cysteine hydrolase [Oscillospiraceae bacterium]
MKNILIVVDMQNDFIDGALGTAEAVSIVENVKRKIEGFDGEVWYTRDTHPNSYMETREGKHLPVPHCIEGTMGWQITTALSGLRCDRIIDKPTFGSTELQKLLTKESPEKITLVGLCTDICVISNAMLLKAALPEADIAVDAACCAGVTPESHARALDAMRMCQIEIENF